MNDDLIDKLAKKAGAGVCCYDDIDLEMFAELIIQECMEQCFSEDDEQRIAKHFGYDIEDEE